MRLGFSWEPIVFTENGTAVDSVKIGGRMVLDHGRSTTIDEKKWRRDAAAAAERLLTANAATRSFARQLQAVVGQFCHRLACEPYHVHRLAAPRTLTAKRTLRSVRKKAPKKLMQAQRVLTNPSGRA